MPPNQALTALRRDAPLVHCITNYVAMNIAANTVLAAGASPAMIHALDEVTEFTPLAGALTINIGTLSPHWATAMDAAAKTARDNDVPWVLDPVAHAATGFRTNVTQRLMESSPAIIRGNASEILALAGKVSAGKGVDSGDTTDAAQDAATALALETGSVIAVSGAEDFVTDGVRHATITGGSDLMPRVTAMGCSLTALMGAYAAVATPFDAALAASVHFAVAGTRAAETASGPGSFSVAFLDALYAVGPDDLETTTITWH